MFLCYFLDTKLKMDKFTVNVLVNSSTERINSNFFYDIPKTFNFLMCICIYFSVYVHIVK